MLKFTPAETVALTKNIIHKIIYYAATDVATLNSISQTCGRFCDYVNETKRCLRYQSLNPNGMNLSFVNVGKDDNLTVCMEVGFDFMTFNSLIELKNYFLKKKTVYPMIAFHINLSKYERRFINDVIYMINYCINNLFLMIPTLNLSCYDSYSSRFYYEIISSIKSVSIQRLIIDSEASSSYSEVEVNKLIKNLPNLGLIEPSVKDGNMNFRNFAKKYKFIFSLIKRNNNFKLFVYSDGMIPHSQWLLEGINENNKRALELIKMEVIPIALCISLTDRKYKLSNVFVELLYNVVNLRLVRLIDPQQFDAFSKLDMSNLNSIKLTRLEFINQPYEYIIALTTFCKKLSSLSNFKQFKLHNFGFDAKYAELAFGAILELPSHLETLEIPNFVPIIDPPHLKFAKKFPNLKKLNVDHFIRVKFEKQFKVFSKKSSPHKIEFLKHFKNLEIIKMSCRNQLNIFIPNSLKVVAVECTCKHFFHRELDFKDQSLCTKLFSEERRCVCLISNIL